MYYQVPQQTSLEKFVSFWAEAYGYAYEPLYTDNIGKRLNEKRILELFIWKNGGKLSKFKEKSVREHYISNLSKLRHLSLNTPPDKWLKLFGTGGPIWNIF